MTPSTFSSVTINRGLKPCGSDRCGEVRTGGRNIDRILRGTILPELAGEFLSRMADGKPIKSVRVGLNGTGFAYTIE